MKKFDELTRLRKSSRCHLLGFTLIEVLATLAALLALAISSVGILSAVTGVGKQSAQSKQARLAIERLAGIFRVDVQSAEEVMMNGQGCLIEMRSPQSVVRYDWDEKRHSLLRVRSQKTRESEQLDRFLLPKLCVPSVSEDGRRVRLTLSIPEMPTPWSIEATRASREGLRP